MLSSEDLYTAPTRPNKRLQTSTPEPCERKPEREPLRCPLKEIINHKGALDIPPVDIIVAPSRQGGNAQRGLQRVQAMAGRHGNQNQNLQGTEPALVQILQMMPNRDANRDNSRKQFLMFPKESFTGQDKKLQELARYHPKRSATSPRNNFDVQINPAVYSSWVVQDRITELANRGSGKTGVSQEI